MSFLDYLRQKHKREKEFISDKIPPFSEWLDLMGTEDWINLGDTYVTFVTDTITEDLEESIWTIIEKIRR